MNECHNILFVFVFVLALLYLEHLKIQFNSFQMLCILQSIDEIPVHTQV